MLQLEGRPNKICSDIPLSGGGNFSFNMLGSCQGSEASLLEDIGVLLDHLSNGAHHG